MGMMSNWTRRKFMKNVALSAGAAAAGAAAPGRMAWARKWCRPARSSSMMSD